MGKVTYVKMTAKDKEALLAAVRQPIYRTWQAIGGDAEAACREMGERLRQVDAVEFCVDADRVAMFGHNDRAQAKAANEVLSAAFQKHGYDHVFRFLCKSISLV